MKIVQINSVYGYGSTGRICKEISEVLWEKGHEVYTAYSAGYTNDKYTYKIGSGADVKLHGLFSRVFGLQGYFSFGATKKLIKYIRRIRPDIIHLHNLHGNYININMLLRFLAGYNISTVVTLHDCFFYTGKCVHYSIAGCYKWKTSCEKCPQLKKHNKSWFFDRTSKMMADKRKYFNEIPRLGVIGVSKWITNEAKQSILKNASIIECIYNWIDLDIFYPHESDIKGKLGIENKIMILGVAISWGKEKGIDDFNILADMLDDKYKIVLVGKKSQCINKKIIHIDRTESIELLSDIYSAADVFYNPTRRETFGKVTAEALACGTPVIAYDTTACTELVNETCGYIERLGDIEAVYRDIEKIAGKKETYVKSCRGFAIQNFNKKGCIDKTVELYERLICKGV